MITRVLARKVYLYGAASTFATANASFSRGLLTTKATFEPLRTGIGKKLHAMRTPLQEPQFAFCRILALSLTVHDTYNSTAHVSINSNLFFSSYRWIEFHIGSPLTYHTYTYSHLFAVPFMQCDSHFRSSAPCCCPFSPPLYPPPSPL
jgi:hypothetical protein